MHPILKDLLENGKKDAFESEQAFFAAAKELGYADEEIENALQDCCEFPLGDEELEGIAGGLAVAHWHGVSGASGNPMYYRFS